MNTNTMTINESLTSRIGKLVSAFLSMPHGNMMLTGILSRTETGWEIGDEPTNSLFFKEEMVQECQHNVIFMRFHKL